MKHSCHAQEFLLTGAASLLLLREKWLWGRAPCKVRGVGESINQTLVLGGRCSETGGFLRLDPSFAYAEASFLMTFAMGGVPHIGSRQTLTFLSI